MLEQQGVTVGVLRPPSASFSELYRDRSEDENIYSELQSELIDSRIDELRDLFREAAEQIGVFLYMRDYQLHTDERGRAALPKGRHARHIRSHDILATVNPAPLQHQFMTNRLRDNMFSRSVAAFTDRDALFDAASILGADRVAIPSLQNAKPVSIRRMFPLHLPPNDEELAKKHQSNLEIVKSAIRYPFIEPTEMMHPFAEVILMSDSNPLCGEQGAKDYLRQEGQ